MMALCTAASGMASTATRTNGLSRVRPGPSAILNTSTFGRSIARATRHSSRYCKSAGWESGCSRRTLTSSWTMSAWCTTPPSSLRPAVRSTGSTPRNLTS
ncbi:hypothetical protein Micbo1qcDRAFT_158233 [Microdochium bolleyi]|uniref:Uncharacterized protein n=1 Tax=Microdochium bolleyi TaxID=196109 RepID=A0A136JFW4_9PEZI|nr:hypothetical protein Micbo1qcDRAFT_158233 [Microdochium bolleyi]